MPIIRINNYIGTRDQDYSSESEYSLSPIRIPYRNRRDFLVPSSHTENNLESPYSTRSESSYSPISSNNESNEFRINIREEDLESSFQNEENNCLICTDNFRDVCKLRCGHLICLSCLMKWFRRSKTCPFCREEINNINFNYLYNPNQIIDNYLEENNIQEETNFSAFCRASEKMICYSSILYWVFIIVSNNVNF